MCLINNEQFEFAIFLDECTVEMTHTPKAFWYRDRPNRIKLVGKYQHPASVHVLGAISRQGRSNLNIFTGKLDSTGFHELCNNFLLPFIRKTFPIMHRDQMDNARPHVSDETRNFFL